MAEKIEVTLEVGQKRTFASAVAWPGWCRSGRNEETALQALIAAGERYARILQATPITFQPPDDTARFTIVEYLAGNATTDFGAPGIIPAGDAQPFSEADLQATTVFMQACWQAFDASVTASAGHALQTGPRGGGRNVPAIVEHVEQSEASYLSRLGWKAPKSGKNSPVIIQLNQREAILETLAAAARGELPTHGPRGGALWPPRYFVRRAAWHLLDHTWEIEESIIPERDLVQRHHGVSQVRPRSQNVRWLR